MNNNNSNRLLHKYFVSLTQSQEGLKRVFALPTLWEFFSGGIGGWLLLMTILWNPQLIRVKEFQITNLLSYEFFSSSEVN